MEVGSNVTCIVCGRGVAKWICKCEGSLLCGEGQCLASHLSKPGKAHAIVPPSIGIWVAPEESSAYFRAVDRAAEIAQFLEGEKAWLSQRKNELFNHIDAKAQAMCKQITDCAARAKQEVKTQCEELLRAIDHFKRLEMKGDLERIKAANQHLFNMDIAPGKFDTSECFFISWNCRTEKVYTHSDSSTGSWGFDGTKIDAFTIQPSKEISLAAIHIGKPKNSMVPTKVKSVEIVEGEKTRGIIVYTHAGAVYYDVSPPQHAVVRLNRPVLLNPSKRYTIKIVAEGGSIASNTGISEARIQEGVDIQAFKSVFAEGDKDNGDTPTSGIFLAFSYLT